MRRTDHAGLLVLLVLVGCVCAAPSLAQTNASGIPPTSYSEFVDPQERVSGENPVGAVFRRKGDTVQPTRLFAWVPSPSRIELHLNSVDGRYTADAEYELTEQRKGKPGWFQLNLDTKHADFIRKYDVDELAVLVRSEKGERVYPVRWGEEGPGDELWIYANTERAKAYFGTKLCATPSKHFGFKFNAVCKVPVGSIADSGRISIKRKHGVKRLAPIGIKVALP